MFIISYFKSLFNINSLQSSSRLHFFICCLSGEIDDSRIVVYGTLHAGEHLFDHHRAMSIIRGFFSKGKVNMGMGSYSKRKK